MAQNPIGMEPILISALQHYSYCPRRAMLVHGEQQWAESAATVEGIQVHERVDFLRHESRGGTRLSAALPLLSEHYGLIGKADLVEFYADDCGAELPNIVGLWKPYPIEYKRGVEQEHEEYNIQLCAQAFCLEEMLSTEVEEGAIYYAASRKRIKVLFTNELRKKTLRTIEGVRKMLESSINVAAQKTVRCNGCSLRDICMPKLDSRAKAYLNNALIAVLTEEEID